MSRTERKKWVDTDTDARLARVLANIARAGPIDDSHVDRDREDWPGQDAADRMADDAADLDYQRRTA